MNIIKSQLDLNSMITYYQSPIGFLEIRGTAENITAVNFVDSETKQSDQVSTLLAGCVQQLDEYFHHKRWEFDLPLSPQGTSFQQSVWDELRKIPYGLTVSYLEIGKRIGNPKAVRAIGSANGANPIPILIPCHRVIGANGKLVGYGGGIWRKEWLLKHEQNILALD